MLKAAMIGMGAAFLAVFLKPVRQEYSMLLILAAGVLILFLGMAELTPVIRSMKEIAEMVKIRNEYPLALIRMIGITYVAEFASGIAKDAGFSSLGKQIELLGKLSILAVSLPILSILVDTMKGIMG